MPNLLTLGAATYIGGKAYDIGKDVARGRPKEAADQLARLGAEGAGAYIGSRIGGRTVASLRGQAFYELRRRI